MTDMGKLNVGLYRSAREALDVALMREVLKALEAAKDDTHDRYTYSAGTVHDSGCRLCRTVRAAITKLEQRLLNE